MPNVPIVTEVTKAQLDALVAANGLNEGLQYNVTDKTWLLVATGVNTLTSHSGELTILNSEGLPEYIDTFNLIIDTGVVSANISALTGVPVVVNVDCSKYLIKSGIVKILTSEDVCSKFQILDNLLNSEIIGCIALDYEFALNMSPVPLVMKANYYPQEYPYKLSAEGIGLSGTTVRVIIYAEKINDLLS